MTCVRPVADLSIAPSMTPAAVRPAAAAVGDEGRKAGVAKAYAAVGQKVATHHRSCCTAIVTHPTPRSDVKSTRPRQARVYSTSSVQQYILQAALR